MGRYAVIVIGPAGAGKSTLCTALQEHYGEKGRTTHIINMDPAAEELLYSPSVDVRDLISLADAMDAEQLGPNGGLVFCMEYIVGPMGSTWLTEHLGEYDEDFVILDMPGQVEVLSNEPAVPALVQLLRRHGYFTTVLYALDALATTADAGKFVSGCMFSLSSMVWFDCPFINVLTKCDLLSDAFKSEVLEHFCMCDFEHMDLSRLPDRFRRMTMEMSRLISSFNLVSFRPMDLTNESYVANLCSQLDETLQVADEMEVRDREEQEQQGVDGDAAAAGLEGESWF